MENPDKKPLLSSKTIITAVVIFALEKFLTPETWDAIVAFLNTFEDSAGIGAVDFLLALFVLLRIVTQGRVDATKWIDVEKIRNKFSALLLFFALTGLFIAFTFSSCQRIPHPKLEFRDKQACARIVGVAGVDLVICGGVERTDPVVSTTEPYLLVNPPLEIEPVDSSK